MISIIVPIYNVEKYLSKCIESLLNQTYKDIEVILVNDGSKDDSLKICREFEIKDKRVIVINQKNRGVSAARNVGIEKASGEYIGFIDPDDWVEKDMYYDMIQEFSNNEVEMVICGYNYYDEEGKIDLSRIYDKRESEYVSQKKIMSMFSDIPPTIRHGVVNKLFRKETVSEQRFDEKLHSSEDVLFLCEYVNKINNAVIIHKPYYCNRVRMGSATHGGLTVKKLADSFYAHDYMYKCIVSKYPDLKQHSQLFLLDVCVLKYKESKNKIKFLTFEEQNESIVCLKKMKKYIKKQAIKAVSNKEIYWKTRIAYLLLI